MPPKGKMGMLLIGEPEESEKETEQADDQAEDDTASATLDTAADELISAVGKKDKAAVAEALRSAFTACREMK